MSTPDTPTSATSPPFTQTREFWVLMGYALVLGVVGALFGLVFMGVIGVGNNWYSVSDPDWFGGHWWWIAVTAGVGIVVGLLRYATHMPEQTPSLIADLTEGHVDAHLVPGIVAVSAASLIGGASLGPEKALGAFGGGLGGLLSQRRGLSEEDTHVNTLTGFAGAYGGLFSSPVIVVMFIVEIARPGGQRLTKTVVYGIVASSVSFGIYFAIAGSVFLDAYAVPQYKFEDWQLLAAVPLGLFAALVTTLLVVVVQSLTRLFARIRVPSIAKSALGGAAFGLVGVVLPLTLFTGSDQLKTVLADSAILSTGLLAALVIGKIFAFAVSTASGFVGGPIFPALFIGGTAGTFVHAVIPSVPLGLAFSCMFAAVPGALISAPFSVVLIAAFMTQVGALQTAPILIAVITAFLAMEGVKYLLTAAKARRARTGPAGPTSAVSSPSSS